MYYVVNTGRVPGIYNTWLECKQQIENYSKPVFKKVETKSEAEYFLKHGKTNKVQTIEIPDGYTVVYTDGSCKKRKDGPIAGYGVYYGDNDPRNISEYFPLDNHTNNRAELYAILACLEKESSNPIAIVTDSKYACDCLTMYIYKWKKNNWKTIENTDVKNSDIILKIWYYIEKGNVIFKHINSHTGCDDIYSYGNKMADKLAQNGIHKKSI